MNAERLIQLYDRIADAPDAVSRLRRFVLDLAVRGKLVEQDPEDEPASELLKRIAAEKTELAKAGEIKPSKSIEVSGSPGFELPPGWALASLGELITTHLGGGTPSKSNQANWGGSIFWASVKDVGKSKYLDATIDCITESGLANSSSNLIPPGNLLIVTRMGLGKVSINRVPVAINQDLRALFLSKHMNIDYCYNFFLTYGFEGTGLTVKGIKLNELLSIPFPLPPLAEQHRIVAKVDELLTLCDRLEETHNTRETTRDRLTTATLTRLTAPDTDKQSFHTHARFALDTLPALTARPDQIKTLRQTILNLAVRGKLVEQDPEDEPASESLKRIVEQRAALIKAGDLRQTRLLPPLTDDDATFPVPTGWTWCRLGDFVLDSDSGWSPRTENHPREGDEWGVLKVSAVSWGRFDPTENKQLLRGAEPRLQAQVHEGDFLLSRANTAELVARAVLIPQEPQKLMMSDKIVRLRLGSDCVPHFVWLVNNYADFARTYYATKATGVSPSMKNVSRAVILELPIPLPPLSEQNRIVAKVDELMGLCDRLEAGLNQADTKRSRLLELLLAEALASAQEEREAA